MQALADSGGGKDMLQMIDSTIIRTHRCAAGERGTQALGRSRGGFSTKIHLRCNAVGLPIPIRGTHRGQRFVSDRTNRPNT